MQADGELVQNVRKEQEEQGHLKSRVKVFEASLGEPIVYLYLRAEIDSFPGFGQGIWQTLQAKTNSITSRAFMSYQLAALKQNVDLIWPCTI